MKKIIQMGMVLSLAPLSLLAEPVVMHDENERERSPSVKEVISNVASIPEKDVDIVYGLKRMFKKGKVLGQIRFMYSDINVANTPDVYASAIGGFLKYELAQFKGFNAAIALTTTHDIDFLSGKDEKYNNELSSSDKSYSETTEAYINYKYENFNLRFGRQTIDTPLADSDDIRMVPNTFEAYILKYKSEHFVFMGGSLKSWQGFDAGLDEPWTTTGSDGTYFGGLQYNSDLVDTNLWYYNINGEADDATANNSYYGDIIGHYHLAQDLVLHAGVQYLKQDELDNSGVASSIYGISTELVVHDIGLNIAYNKASKKQAKQSFSGFGGGTLFTNMDSMILDVIAVDREADALVTGISYEINDFHCLYAYGDFSGDSDSNGVREHIVEQNVGVTYEHRDLTLGAVYTHNDDKENTNSNNGDWDNLRVLLAYNF